MQILIPENVKLSESTSKDFEKELVKDFRFSIDGHTSVIKTGFKTNGASIPRWLWWLYHPFDKDVLNSAVIHDWHYYRHEETRKECDNIFLESMYEDNVRFSKARAFYRTVWALGWTSYRKYKGNDKKDLIY